MMKKKQAVPNQRTILFFLTVMFAFLMVLAPSETASATSVVPIYGSLGITYSSSTGKLTAVYDYADQLSSSAVYTWYKDGATAGNGTSYAPSSAGTYYCTLRDSVNYDGILTSSSITLYRASGSNITFDNSYGLYEAGDNVSVTATLNDGQTVTNWKTSAEGVAIPQTGKTVSFRMPAQNVTVTVTVKSLYTIKVYGGTADSYQAYTGDTVTITASDVGGKQFVSWSTTGGKLGDPSSKTTTLTVANSNIVATANFKGTVSTETSSSSQQGSYNGKADASHAVYQVLNSGGYSVQVSHHEQGPLCDAAFKYAQGQDWLVTDYFNITVNNSFTTYEIGSPIKIQLTIPDDLITANRKWRMVCVSRDGSIYSFPDEDANDSTITFSPDRFYAYAMCYNDITESHEEVIVATQEASVEEAPVLVAPAAPQSELHSANDSRTAASAIHSADASVTTNTTGVATPAAAPNSKIKSDQISSVERADGASVALISM